MSEFPSEADRSGGRHEGGNPAPHDSIEPRAAPTAAPAVPTVLRGWVWRATALVGETSHLDDREPKMTQADKEGLDIHLVTYRTD